MPKKTPISEQLSTAERDDLLRDLYRAGKTQSEIAREMGLSRQRIWQLLDELKVTRRKRYTREERLAQIPRLINQGLTGLQMGKHLGVAKSAIYGDMAAIWPTLSRRQQDRYEENRRRPLRERKGSRHPLFEEAIDKRRARILPLINRGWHLSRIADQFAVTTQTIRNDLTAMKVGQDVEDRIHENRVAQGRRTRASRRKA